MTKLFEEQRFEAIDDSGSGRSYQDLEFRRCYFQGCFTVAKKPKRRISFRNVRLLRCEQRGCTIEGTILEEVFVDGLATNGLLQTWAAVFKHVVLRGNIGRVMFSHLSDPTSPPLAKENIAFSEANAAYYAGVDWALDISNARFEECDLRGVPGRLVRRDPETQILVTRGRVVEGAWKRLDLSGTYWRSALEGLLEDGRESEVLVAPKGARDFEDLLAGLNLLREAGVAEPE